MKLEQIETPAALIDVARMQKNIARMQGRMNELGVAFRPHVKTTKCIDVVRAQIAAGARGITVSTLKEAEAFFAAGVDDILYAVSMVPSKLPRALALRRQGCDLKLVVDNPTAAAALAAFGDQHGETFEVWIEVDTDGHRSGIQPEQQTLLDVGRILHENGVKVGGVMTHAGSSYELNTPEALAALAEQERAGCVRAAERLREAGIACPAVSVGSTPTALAARNLEGVTEVRAGVYVLFDLVMHNVGVCTLDDIALSVLTTVIGHQEDKGWAILDAGWMALSRDRGTSRQSHDFGYGQPCLLNGTLLPGYVVSGANQEHGILAAAQADPQADAQSADIAQRFPIGMKLRILPNHACATGAQFPEYHAVAPDGSSVEWQRFYGW
ncbi:D-serine deaminase-like pyridoxal phosphate-dependent protein [Paraburkholderia atlantica]|uniref:D-serine deaminase-like pyridoxal phosphate-dependent protein n=1 Tax=Paraburkholderia atlantica TaxID=2654982 RepID=A0A7W8Q843_PARAM|nr:DSD1 family PLP-dependent enzyme [Paraburkholderia atlantica]MBB5425461.1 D-serine deaminase-like pyridoxal phosphate-dependent protein [Paraburkholderia atlantica]